MDPAVTAVVERTFGAAPDWVERAESGRLHDTYFVDAAGTAAVVQFASEREDALHSLRLGTNCYRLFRDTPVPVPDVLSDGVETYDGREFAVVERLPGEPADGAVTPARMRAAGRTLARIHACGPTFDAPGRLRFEGDLPVVDPAFDPDYRGWLLGELRENLDTLREAGFDAADAVAALFDEARDRIPTAFEPVLCHDDFSPENVLFDGDEVTGVLDFDRAYAGHAARDAVKAVNAAWLQDPVADWPAREPFYAGYRSVRDLPENFDRVEPLYRVESLVAPVAGMLELGAFSESEAAFYDDRLAETVEAVRAG
jgi:Ser/Thr protein kinase RdoA (MazF antagonist)